MDANRFDTLTKALASGVTRRATLRGIGASLAAVAAMAGRHPATAQESATPAATPALPAPEKSLEYLFVQTFASGTFASDPERPEVFTLTLEQNLGQTLYFAERPSRLAGMMPTAEFLPRLGFDSANPPNAALVATTDSGEAVAVVTLSNPRYDTDAGTLAYDVQLNAGYDREKLSYFQVRATDQALPERFGAASLFIDAADDCEGCGYSCFSDSDCCAGLTCEGGGISVSGSCTASCCGGGCDCACERHRQ